VHALVEAELDIRDGIWGCVADGVVWTSMRHVSGRRPPRAAERSARLKKERSAAIRRAETVADLAFRIARGAEVLPGEIAASGLPSAALSSAAERLRSAGREWAALPPGHTRTLEWPGSPRGERPFRDRAGSRTG
jgi:hypothetical protein